MEIIRDPLWNNIRVDPLALALIDTPAFQRLRYVRQLGLAHLVYPGATHTRFEHALGAYHLARTAMALLRERGDLDAGQDRECAIAAAAALLHDIGHYPFSHALEEIGAPHHEDLAHDLITRGAISVLLRDRLGPDAPELVVALIRGESTSPLQGLISGSLDLDKIEYLKRDAFMCGVAYGEIDVDRLVNSLLIIREEGGRIGVGVAEKGLSALESLLFAKYQMYRNVYWHHAVRSATAMYKRLVDDAREERALRTAELAIYTDEGLLADLERRAPSRLLSSLRARHLYKRVVEWPASELVDAGVDVEWIATDRERVRTAERTLAADLMLEPEEVLLDFPAKTQMLGLDIPVLRRDGSVVRLTEHGLGGAINLPRMSQELYHSARWLRVFSARRVTADPQRILAILAGGA